MREEGREEKRGREEGRKGEIRKGEWELEGKEGGP